MLGVVIGAARCELALALFTGMPQVMTLSPTRGFVFLLQNFGEDIEAHREIMQNLDRTGTYLKYFGRKQDTVYIKNLLISIKLRWKKLVRRADEKGRLLQQAYKEDKRVSQ